MAPQQIIPEIRVGVNPETEWEDLKTENGLTLRADDTIEVTFLGEKLSGDYRIYLGPGMGDRLLGEWTMRLEKYYTGK